MVHDSILALLLVTFLGKDEVGVHSVEIAQKNHDVVFEIS